MQEKEEEGDAKVEEEQVLLKASNGEEDIDSWYLDTASNNHMTGVKSLFASFDEKVIGNIVFGMILRHQYKARVIFLFMPKMEVINLFLKFILFPL